MLNASEHDDQFSEGMPSVNDMNNMMMYADNSFVSNDE